MGRVVTLVLDTSALIFRTLAPARLTAKAKAACDRADRIVVSSISIWEIGLKVRNKALHLPMSLADYVTTLQGIRRLALTPVDTATWLDNLALDWTHKDPADRTIVATAQRLDAPLVTSDRTIRAFYSKAIW